MGFLARTRFELVISEIKYQLDFGFGGGGGAVVAILVEGLFMLLFPFVLPLV